MLSNLISQVTEYFATTHWQFSVLNWRHAHVSHAHFNRFTVENGCTFGAPSQPSVGVSGSFPGRLEKPSEVFSRNRDSCWLVVTGTWRTYDFPETVGNVIIPSDFHHHISQRGRAKNHQPGWYIMIYPMISRISIRNIHPKKGNSWNLDSPGFYWDSSSWLGIVRRRMTARIPW